MAENLTVTEPDFDLIEKESGTATRNGIETLWRVANAEAKQRRTFDQVLKDTLAPKVLVDAPGATQNNYDLASATILLLTGSVNRTFTGFRAPDPGQSRVLFVHVIGSATYTLAHASASSEAENRLRTKTGSDITLATDESAVFLYVNTLWRQLNLV